MFAHLNLHSVYSKMWGMISLEQVIYSAKKQGQKYVALTDINGVWAFITFVEMAQKNGLKPIAASHLMGEEIDVILLAETTRGYENICFILSERHRTPKGSLETWVKGKTQDIFFLSPQKSNLKLLAKYVPANHLFMELRPGMEEAYAHNLAKELKLETIVTADAYFFNKADVTSHKVLRAIELNSTVSHLKKADYKNSQHYLRNKEELEKLFPNSIQAIENSALLAKRCKTDWNYITTIFPQTTLAQTNKANTLLKKRVKAGALKRYGNLTVQIKKRINYEFSIIIPKGFAPYFLVVADIVAQTKSTIGRGSGAASIISYCLEITQVDPIKYNLQFERFIHPEREDMPDIDIDFPWDERDAIFDYIFKKYGQNRAAMVSNHVFLRPRSAVREVAKVYGLSNEEINSVTKRISFYHKRNDLFDWVSSDKRFENVDINNTLKEILLHAEKLIGSFRNSSIHSGGIIITPDDIRNYVPVLKAPKGVQIVEWEKEQVEDSGLLKIDILGNRSLAVVRDTLEQVRQYHKLNVSYHSLSSAEDEATIALMERGDTMGLFYIESPATRLLLKKAGMANFELVVIYSSIIRPAANRYINVLIERLHGAPWKLLHPDLHCLEETYGIMVYEEQVSMVAHDIAGFSYKDSDFLRKVISKPRYAGIVEEWKAKFMNGAKERGYSLQLAQILWEMIQSFSGYSFCKPHSASYAMLSFTCAYLKAHYPAEFMSSVISNQGGYYSSYAYFSEVKRMGIKILFPDINLSNYKHKGKKGRIRIGFMAINRLQKKAVEHIIEEREKGFFSSLKDFVNRTHIHFSDAIALTNAGCFNTIEKELSHQEITFRVSYYYLREDESEPNFTIKGRPLQTEEMRQLEISSFGYPISFHPLEVFLPTITFNYQKANKIETYSGQKICLLGVHITRKVTATKQNEPMVFITFEDETAIYETVVFPKIYSRFLDLLHWERYFYLEGVVDESFGTHTIVVKYLESLQRKIDTKFPLVEQKKHPYGTPDY